MAKRTKRPDSIVPFYLYGGHKAPSVTSRFSVRSVLLWSAALALIGLVSWLYLLQASQVATYAYEIRTLQQDTEHLRRQIAILGGQVAQAASLERVHQVAETWEYSLPKGGDPFRRMTLSYVPLPAAVAKAQPNAAALSDDSLLPPGRLFDRLNAQLRAWFRSAEESGIR